MQADSTKITNLLKTARGQIDGILKMAENNQYCMDISHQLLACEAVLRKANREVLRRHMEGCVQEAFNSGTEAETSEIIDELITILDRFTKI